MVSAVHASNQCGPRVYTRVLRSTMVKRVVNKVPITVLYDVSNVPPFDLCNLLYETSFWVQTHCFMLANFLNFLLNFPFYLARLLLLLCTDIDVRRYHEYFCDLFVKNKDETHCPCALFSQMHELHRRPGDSFG